MSLLAADGGPGMLAMTALVAAGGVTLEAILFRGLFELGRDLSLSGQRLAAIAILVAFLVLLLLLEFPLAVSFLRLGRHLEMRFRVSFLRKLPTLGDGYFRSRLTSDLAERSHNVYRIRELPELTGQFLRLVFELVLTTAGII
jgi:ATP-binding cassette subfamily B protein